MGDTQRSKALLERALSICDRVFGPESFRAADMIAGLAVLEANMGHLPVSSSLLEKAIQIRRIHQGSHIQLANNLWEMSSLLIRLGDTARSFDAALEAETISRRNLELTLRVLPERQALINASTRVLGLDRALGLVAADAPVSRALAMDALIRARALVFDEMAARHRLLSYSRDSAGAPDIARLTQDLVSARESLSRLVVTGKAKAETLADASREKERLESALAEKSTAFRQELASRRAGLAEVAGSLGSDSALVSFASYRRSDVEHEPSGKTATPGDAQPYYLAFVLRGGTEEPKAVSLGSAQQLDALVAALRKQVSDEAMAPGQSPKRSEAAYRAAGEALRRRIWDPLVPFIGSAHRVFIVPDGTLHLINFAALPVGGAEYLIQNGPLIHYLSAERDLLPVLAPAEGRGLLALGDPDFDSGEILKSGNARVYRGNRSSCGTFQSMQFEPLPGSSSEIDQIASFWKRDGRFGEVRELRRKGATEAAFKLRAQGMRVLHLATHGFFLGDCPSAVANRVGDRIDSIRGENPLLLSGLAMGGANRRNDSRPPDEDGILTAEEIAAMDLSGVEWAVLSACETGLGKIEAGEGVFGLRRAFQVAGAHTVIMSLWPVEDHITRRWMTALYRQRFVRHLSTAESVRAASVEVFQYLRANHLSTHPFYWAGFIAAGDWK
jgi:CHAT domain-containing protein